LKVDSFHSRGLAKSMHAQSIVNMLIELARAERIGVVVEGVDGIGSWEWLRLNRCTGVEAPFITPSMSLEDALQWLPLWQYRVVNAHAAGQTVGAMLAEFQVERLPDFPAANSTLAMSPGG